MIESPKNFIEQFQNFIEHIAGVMKTFLTKEVADSYYLGKSAQSLTPEQKAQVVQNLAGTFLPLAGGTVTGTIKSSNEVVIQSNATDKTIHIRGGASTRDGAEFIVSGKDYLPDLGLQGFFRLSADNGVSEGRLEGLPNGSLKWNYKEVERVNTIGENYIRFESGLQICWGGFSNTNGNSDIIYPIPFKGAASPMLSIVGAGPTAQWTAQASSESLTGFTCSSFENGTLKQAGVSYLVVGKWK